MSAQSKKILWAGVLGALFGLGLAMSKMLDPQVALDFFDLSGHFNPMLGLVFVGALAVSLVGYRIATNRPKPLIENRFHIPTNTTIDKRLVIGAALFGIGWGLAGYCPAPLVGTVFFNWKEALIFGVPMVAGFWIGKRLVKRFWGT